MEQFTIDDLELMTILGEGGWGCVRLCRHKSNNKYYAVKMMSKRGLIDEKQQ